MACNIFMHFIHLAWNTQWTQTTVSILINDFMSLLQNLSLESTELNNLTYINLVSQISVGSYMLCSIRKVISWFWSTRKVMVNPSLAQEHPCCFCANCLGHQCKWLLCACPLDWRARNAPHWFLLLPEMPQKRAVTIISQFPWMFIKNINLKLNKHLLGITQHSNDWSINGILIFSPRSPGSIQDKGILVHVSGEHLHSQATLINIKFEAFGANARIHYHIGRSPQSSSCPQWAC